MLPLSNLRTKPRIVMLFAFVAGGPIDQGGSTLSDTVNELAPAAPAAGHFSTDPRS